MLKSKVYIPLILLITLPSIILSQPIDLEWFKTKSTELNRAGIVLINNDQFLEALDTLSLALNYRKKGYPNDQYYWGATYMYLGITCKNLGRLDESIEYYNLTRECFLTRENINPINYARLYTNFGNAYRSKLDYVNALNYFEEALKIYKEQNDEYYVYLSIYSIAEVKHLMKLDNEAKQLLELHYSNTDTENRIYFSELLAIIYQTQDNYPLAEKHYKTAIQLFKEYYGKEDIDLAVEYMNYAEFLSEMRNFQEGMNVLNQALEIITLYQTEKGSTLAKYYEYKGDLYRRKTIATPNILLFRNERKANLQEALIWYNESLNALYTGAGIAQIDKLTINNSLSLTDCLVLLKTIADTYSELALLDREEKSEFYKQSLEDALAYYKVISELVQRARQEISDDESKIQLAQLEYETFTKTIETAYLAYELNRDEEYLELAFSNSEQIKSSAVFDKISTNLAQENSLIPDSLLEQESKLNSTISFYNEKVFEEQSSDDPDSALLQEYDSIIFEAGRQRDEFNRFLEDNYSDYYELKYSNSMLGISEIQKELDKKDAILEYVLTESDSTQELFTFLITSNKKEIVRQTVTHDMKQSLEYIFNFMTTPNYLFTKNEDSKQFCTAANNAYQLLIEPFSKDLINKNLIIIPDAELNYIAFDGLLKTLPDTTQLIDFAKLDYLLRYYNVNYANSANILMKYRGSKKNMSNKILAFAPVYDSEEFTLSNASYTLMPLPGVQKEVDAISELVKTSVYRGQEASEENFRENCSDYDILHLAMHAYINDSLPAFSRLAFSPEPGVNDILKDGWLNTADIYNLDLKNARLAVLSACNTGVGKMQKGEGLMSLARGFLYAGCPSIVMSLWEVEDNAGTQIMTSFYKNLEKGKTKDAALREAKLKYLENANSRLAHPHYWMSFKCIGNNAQVYNSYDIYFFAFLIALILFFSIDQGIRIRKARRKRQAS